MIARPRAPCDGAAGAGVVAGARGAASSEGRSFWVLRRTRPFIVARQRRGTRRRFACPRTMPRPGRQPRPVAVTAGARASALALLDGRALDGEQLLDVDHAEHLVLDRRPVGLLSLRAEIVGEVRVDLLPRGVAGPQRRGRVGDDPD